MNALVRAVRAWAPDLPPVRVVRVSGLRYIPTSAFGICFPPGARSKTYTILVDDDLGPAELRPILYHELAHVLAMTRHQCYDHGPPWERLCAQMRKQFSCDFT